MPKCLWSPASIISPPTHRLYYVYIQYTHTDLYALSLCHCFSIVLAMCLSFCLFLSVCFSSFLSLSPIKRSSTHMYTECPFMRSYFTNIRHRNRLASFQRYPFGSVRPCRERTDGSMCVFSLNNVHTRCRCAQSL